MVGNKNATADVIPVDTTVNLMISASWYIGAKSEKKFIIFNGTSGQINNFKWGNLERWTIKAVYKNPFENIFWIPSFSYTKNRYLISILFILEMKKHKS